MDQNRPLKERWRSSNGIHDGSSFGRESESRFSPFGLTRTNPLTRVCGQEPVKSLKLLAAERLEEVFTSGELHATLREQA